jgi:electron transfer flavoprotein beta subunit
MGLEHLELSLPAVVSVDLRLNEPRYATLPNIMKSKSKPLSVKSLSELNIGIMPSNLQCEQVLKPNTRAKGEILGSIEALIEKVKPLIQS